MAHIRYLILACTLSFFSLFGKEAEKKVTLPATEEKSAIVPVTTDMSASLPAIAVGDGWEVLTKAEALADKRKITVKNTIVKKDLGYYKCWMTHYPSEFSVHVNGKKLESNEQLVVEEPRLTIIYFYEWSSPFGRVKKNKTLTYDIDQKTDHVNLSFTSWKEDEPRIKAPGCVLVSVTEVEEANTIPKDQVSQFIAQAGTK